MRFNDEIMTHLICIRADDESAHPLIGLGVSRLI